MDAACFPMVLLDKSNLWLNCCIEHDKAYWQGGAYSGSVAPLSGPPPIAGDMDGPVFEGTGHCPKMKTSR